MNNNPQNARIEYGDFQTPVVLARHVCQKLVAMGVTPQTIIEPTCGVGAFVEAAAEAFPDANHIFGVEVNPDYVQQLTSRLPHISGSQRIQLLLGDFYHFDWDRLISNNEEPFLIVGNFPWVTNTQQSVIGGTNVPDKTNFLNHNGLDAITGKSNFDVSEWMFIRLIEWLRGRNSYIAMLCKTSVARKVLGYLHSRNTEVEYSAMFNLDAKKHFNASVDACLFFCHLHTGTHIYTCDVFENLDSQVHHRIGYRQNTAIRDMDAFDELSHLYGSSREKWRSGVKHDCSRVMELSTLGIGLINGFDELVQIEDTYLYPLIKGTDVARNRVASTNKQMLVTQMRVGEPTNTIKQIAPGTWEYLQKYAEYLDNRKSRIYKDNPRFAIFGVGSYTFAPWKIAISGLHKSFTFRLVGPIRDKPVVFDDTVYFLPFQTEAEAQRVFDLINTPEAIRFLSSLVFWDDKRPIKTSLLNSLNLDAIAPGTAGERVQQIQMELNCPSFFC